jgi:hypothetical protein
MALQVFFQNLGKQEPVFSQFHNTTLFDHITAYKFKPGAAYASCPQQIKGYRQQDPPTQHKLAVPVSLIEYLVKLGKNSPSDKVAAICDMFTIAFYYLLHVGEYTGHHKLDRRCTKHFRACDITFYDSSHTIIPNTAPLDKLYTAAKAAMRITNQRTAPEAASSAMTPPIPRHARSEPSHDGSTPSCNTHNAHPLTSSAPTIHPSPTAHAPSRLPTSTPG